MKEVKNLRDSLANAASSLDKLRTDYAFSNDAGERARLTETILGLEMKLPLMQRALDVSNNELRTIEMEFLKEGIFMNMNPFEEEISDEQLRETTISVFYVGKNNEIKEERYGK